MAPSPTALTSSWLEPPPGSGFLDGGAIRPTERFHARRRELLELQAALRRHLLHLESPVIAIVGFFAAFFAPAAAWPRRSTARPLDPSPRAVLQRATSAALVPADTPHLNTPTVSRARLIGHARPFDSNRRPRVPHLEISASSPRASAVEQAGIVRGAPGGPSPPRSR